MELVLAVTSGQARLGWALIVIGLFFTVAGGLLLLRNALKEAMFTTQAGLPGFGDVIGWLVKQGLAGGITALGLILIALGMALLGIKIW